MNVRFWHKADTQRPFYSLSIPSELSVIQIQTKTGRPHLSIYNESSDYSHFSRCNVGLPDILLCSSIN